MKRDVLELETTNPLEALSVLNNNNVEAAVFGSVLHTIVQDKETAIPHITKLLQSAGITLHRAEKIIPSLEDVFVTMIETA